MNNHQTRWWNVTKYIQGNLLYKSCLAAEMFLSFIHSALQVCIRYYKGEKLVRFHQLSGLIAIQRSTSFSLWEWLMWKRRWRPLKHCSLTERLFQLQTDWNSEGDRGRACRLRERCFEEMLFTAAHAGILTFSLIMSVQIGFVGETGRGVWSRSNQS